MLEKLFHFISALTQSIFTFLKILMRSRLRPHLPRATADSCIILGNGPSLKPLLKDHLAELKQRELICVNKFPDTPYYTQLKPAYFIFVSPEFWATNTIDPNTSVRKDIIKALIEKTTWELTLFCPYKAKKAVAFLQRIQQNKHIKIVFFNDTPLEGLSSMNRFFMKQGWGAPRPHNVLIPAILMAINSGFKTIYLTGADHSWLPLISVNSKNEAMVNQQHFYDADTSKSDIMYKSGIRPRRLHEILEKFMYAFRSYFDLRDYAESRGVQLYNSTPDSYIDAFERKFFL